MLQTRNLHTTFAKLTGVHTTYKQAVAKGTVNDYKHTSSLPKAVMSAIKPVFKDLASTQLLEKVPRRLYPKCK